MSNQTQNLVKVLQSAKPAEIVEIDAVKEKFIAMHNAIHGSDKGEMIYHKEAFNFKKQLAETPGLKECSQLSLYGVFLDINVNGLSLEQGSKPDCYIIAKSHKTGKKDAQNKDIYEKRASLQVSPYGELKLRMRAGQVKYADNPVIVYDCDTFEIGLNERGKQVVLAYKKMSNRPEGAKIVASFVRIERPDGSYEMPYLDQDDIQRLKGYSERQNSKWDDVQKKKVPGKANALYTSNGGQIDTGFLAAKTIKHAFSTYPKVPTGKFSSLQEEFNHTEIDYGIDPEAYTAGLTEDVEHVEVKDEPSFDDFDKAVEDAQVMEEVETTQVENDCDEPEF
ncbi:recombinase RecT [Sphingobacterium yanglingense]|uniref:RecT family protein n=1 Tax=Sphingobacterium yanglingense TaxID=1437280 RepID=A0A4R6WL76_9SPHI|nr:recombinase RecT [Sphingobacterium yanglingense]TDQ79528.1 RecT family protein [Sphingobacterium yanglingense]